MTFYLKPHKILPEIRPQSEKEAKRTDYLLISIWLNILKQDDKSVKNEVQD